MIITMHNECHNKRKEVRNFLKKIRRTNNRADRENYCRTRREYKYLLDRKKKDHNRNIIDRLVASIENEFQTLTSLFLILPNQFHISMAHISSA